jgi:signal transduction histidine kinase
MRTPLQAFQSELEVLQDTIASEMKTKLSSLVLCSIKQLEGICDFMNMTINRSIDFMKASSGIILNPSIESVNFSDTLNSAVGFMVKSHVNVPIIVSPIPKSIHNQIFTDKQWLMENILCLLSNAQKFTTEGEIVIRCSLHSSNEDTSSVLKSEMRSANSYADANEDIESGSPMLQLTETASPLLRIEVADTGIGVKKEIRESLFKPFAQVIVFMFAMFIGLGVYCLFITEVA